MTISYHSSKPLQAGRFVQQVDNILEKIADTELLTNPEFQRRIKGVEERWKKLEAMPPAEALAWIDAHSMTEEEFVYACTHSLPAR
jgi:hypothetical protein